MAEKERQPAPIGPTNKQVEDITTDLVGLMPRDLAFTMRFLGESQYRLQRHFQDFMLAEMAAAGLTEETHPMIHAFVERHAIMLRDFVFSGVSLSRQFHVEEIERLIGDTTSLLRVDIWDQLRSHIDMAQKQFRQQLPGLPQLLSGFEAPTEAPETGR